MLHPCRQRLHPSCDQIAVKRREHIPKPNPLGKRQLLEDPIFVGDNCTSDRVGVPIEILGSAVDDDICTQIERGLEVRTREGPVHPEQRVVVIGDVGHRPDVTQLHQRVRRRLRPNQVRVRIDCIGDVFGVTGVNEIDVDTEVSSGEFREQFFSVTIDRVTRLFFQPFLSETAIDGCAYESALSMTNPCLV